MSPPKSCAVCGDKALGYNFNAITCESCKAFFRRNALSKKQFTCPFNQNCEITQVTRRFCQKCRLKKCLDIGMKSENIMSEEDKLIKRRKIESNRAKRRLTEPKTETESQDGEDNENQQAVVDSSSFDPYSSLYDSQSCGSVESQNKRSSRATSLLDDPMRDVNPELMDGEEIVEFIVSDPDRASQAISKLMRTPAQAVSVVEKIISSQKDALKLISHLISYPGDALKIISKIMNSPFNALTVFTKFMSSPTDALEIISKIVSSPQDVLQFVKNLMDSPEDALDIMNKFMNTPAEALRIINRLFNGVNASSTSTDATDSNASNDLPLTSSIESNDTPFQSPVSQMTSPENDNTILQSMLNHSPNSSQIMMSPATSLTPAQTVLSTTSMQSASPFPASPNALSLASPMSVSTTDMTFHSPMSLQNDELPSTSAAMIGSSPTNVTSESDFGSDHFDIRAFIQNSLPDNSLMGDSTNSLESVLSEVIRIEFQAFNNLPQEPRIKHEHNELGRMQSSGNQYVTCNPNQHSICAPSSAIMGRDLNDAEQQKLRELKLASEALFYPVDDEISVLMMNDDRIKTDDSRQDPKLLQVINLTAVAIKRLIKMAKKITAFRDMCQEDQVALLKGGCTEMMIMRSAMTYDNNCNTWKIPHTKEDMSNIRAEVLKLAKGNVYEEHVKFMTTFDERWRTDENIILILCAIVLFSPSRPRVVHSDVIKLEQNSYYYLLRRYLESVCSGCEAKSAFIKLIQKISDVERLNQVFIGVYLNVNPSQVEPLLREIFDLKNH